MKRGDDLLRPARNQRDPRKLEGVLSALISLVKKGRLTVEEAVEESKMSVAEFRKQAGITTAQ